MLDKFFEFFSDWWDTFIDFFLWLPVKIMDLFLGGFASLVEAIPSPSFVAGTTLGDYIDPDILWMLNQSGVNVALGIMASAIIFRFLRRIGTLGVW